VARILPSSPVNRRQRVLSTTRARTRASPTDIGGRPPTETPDPGSGRRRLPPRPLATTRDIADESGLLALALPRDRRGGTDEHRISSCRTAGIGSQDVYTAAFVCWNRRRPAGARCQRILALIRAQSAHRRSVSSSASSRQILQTSLTCPGLPLLRSPRVAASFAPVPTQ
jgi:hypothetical protein